MASNLKGYIKALKEFKTNPEPELFDQIYDKVKKPKKKRRFILWFCLCSVLGTSAYLVMTNGKASSSFEQANIVEISNVSSTDTALNNENEQQYLLNQNIEQSAVRDAVSLTTTDSIQSINSTPSQIDSTSNVNDKNVYYKSKSINTTSNTRTLHSRIRKQANIDLDDKITLNNLQNLIHNNSNAIDKIKTKESVEKRNDFGIENYELNNTKIDGKRIFSEVKSVIANLPLLPKRITQGLNLTSSVQLLNKPIFTFSDNQKISNRYIRIEAMLSQSQICQNGKASSAGIGADFIMPLFKKLNLSIGASHQSLKYDFDFDNDMIQAYGNTDKYPGMFFLRDRMLSVNNKMEYQTLAIGLNLELLSFNKFSFEWELSQNLIVNSHQILSYELLDNLAYTYKRTNHPFSLGQGKSSLRVIYDFSDFVDFYALLSYGQSLQFIGIEKEKYSGFSYGLGIRYQI